MSELLDRLREAMADRYAIDSEIGRGGMAAVYLATDLKHERSVAIKVMLPAVASELGTDRFLREIRVAANLNHPHILPVYDSGEAGGTLYYVMPLVEGESLRNRLNRETRLPVDEAVAIAREVADGLTYAHAHGVIHRDIKPENILLSDGHAFVADFGIARAVEEAGGERLTATGFAVGTPAYMSPEQSLGASGLDGRSDVYSLACVLYEMLAGETPFAAPDSRAILARKTAESPRSLRSLRPQVPEVLEAAVGRALLLEPADRFRSAAEFGSALQGALTPVPTPIPAPWPAPRLDSAGRRVLPWVVGLIAVVSAVAVGTWWTLSNRTVPGALQVQTAPDVAGEGIAVLPFRVVGMESDLWRDGLVDALSSNLDGLGGLRKIDPRIVLANWNRLFGESTGVSELSAVQEMAAGIGARYAVLGRLVSLEGRATLSADVYDVRDGSLRGSIEAVGSPDDVTFLVNQATLQILDLVGSGIEVTDITLDRLTRSSAALRNYLRGEQVSRKFRWEEALDHFDEAIAADSTFVLAVYKAWMGCEWTNCPRYEAYQDLAHRFSGRLPERDRGLLEARALRTRGNPKAITALEAFVTRFPDEVLGWYELGEAYFHLGPRAPSPLSQSLFRAPFRRALELDPGFVTLYAHLFTDAFVRDDSAALAELIREHRRADTTSQDLMAAEIAFHLVWGDSTSRSRALEQAEAADGRPAENLGVYGISNPELGRRMPRGGFFVVERSLVHSHAGQPDSAWLAAATSEDPLSASVLRLVTHLQGLPSAHDTRALVTVLGPSSDPWTHFLLGALAVQEGRWEDVGRETEWLTAATQGMDLDSYGAAAARSLEAYAQARRSDVGAGVASMERLLSDPSGFEYAGPAGLITTSFVHGLLRQEMGRLLLSSGRLAEARRYFESLTYPIWEPNVGLAEACLGEAYEREGEPDLAARHYERMAWWWQNGEPAYRAMAEQGRLAAKRLERPDVNAEESAANDGLCERAFSPASFPLST